MARCGTLNELVNNPKRTTAVFAALADPTRRRILLSLAGNDERPVSELARPFRISSPAISRHLRILERARLIHRRREGRNHLIRGNQSGLVLARQWLVQCEAGWNHSFGTLDRLLRNQHRKGTRA